MTTNDRTSISPESIAQKLRETIGEVELESLARECGLLQRKRNITPFGLVAACLSTLGASDARWIADIHRTYNKQADTAVQYKPFHKQLAKEAFPRFLHKIVEKALKNFAMPILASLPASKLVEFRDIVLHDGCSFALKDTLSKQWPGRFTKVTPAAVELHVTMSALRDQALAITLAPDKEAERQFGPKPSDVKGCLLLEDRGYEHKQFFAEVQKAGGSYIVRGKSNIRPTICRAYNSQGHRLRHLEGKRLQWKILPQETVDLDLEWGRGKNAYKGRLIAIYKRGKRNRKTYTYLHTNLKRSKYRHREVATLYRLRWQIELLFKEWKSHANLHRFDTGKSAIAEGLIWASILAATLKRYVLHGAETVLGAELSTMRAASCARHFLDDILAGLARGSRSLARSIHDTFLYLGRNAQRAHPERDRRRGRLASGIRPCAVIEGAR